MNRLKERRTELSLSQPDVVRLLRVRCPIMDVSLYSKIENGHCLPNKDTLEALEAALQAPVSVLFEPDELAAIGESEGARAAQTLTPPPYYAMLEAAIPHGRRNAITREALAAKLGMSDRQMRKAIEDARYAGLVILNAGDGIGYFQSDNIAEIEQQYKTDRSRAISVLYRCKVMRRILKEAGRPVR